MKTLTATFLAFFCAVGHAQPLKLTHTVPLPGVSGRFDHFAVDTKRQRLFVAALGNNTVEVIDLQTFTRVATIRGQHKPQGVLYLPEADEVFVANGEDGTLRQFEGAGFAPGARIDGLDDADNVRFDAKARQIFVGYGEGALAVMDPTTARLSGRVELKGHPESFQLARSGPRIYVNVPDAKMIAVVDREKRTVIAEWPMQKFQSNFPMALDEAGNRLFVGCRRPARLVVVDTTTGKSVADLEISGDTDDLFFDAKRQRLYISCGEGFLDVIQRREGDRYERIGRLATRAGARTSFFSSDLDRLFLAVPQRGAADAEIRAYAPN